MDFVSLYFKNVNVIMYKKIPNTKSKLVYLVELDKDTIVDLSKSEKLKGLANLGGNLVNTIQGNNQ